MARFVLVGLLTLFGAALGLAQEKPKRPNIVWIVAEDHGLEEGCYGHPDAVTPNLDRLASQGARYTRCFTHAPVCAPSRSGLVTGCYPTTIGSQHMRSTLKEPPTTFMEALRKAGYHVAWPGKTDFNFAPPKGAFSSTRPWLNDPPPQPFFAYHNIQVSHESQARAAPEQYAKNIARLKDSEKRDPKKVQLPPYYPDTPAVRRNVANYHEMVTAMDYQVDDVLTALDKHKLSDNTIVFFFGDHGWGLPRGKRWVYDSGTHVPLLIRWPGTIKPGSVVDDLVAFIDFAPTVLSLAGAETPKTMQGQVFLGEKPAQPRRYAFSARDRMDETYDRIRSVRDARYRYVRNYHPELPYAQYINYMDEMPIMKEWRRLYREGKLEGASKLFFSATKPREELYDTKNDPHEIKNLANSAEHQAKLKELRAALDEWVEQTKDLGAVSEAELIKRGLVVDRTEEYEARRKLHPKEPPVKPE